MRLILIVLSIIVLSACDFDVTEDNNLPQDKIRLNLSVQLDQNQTSTINPSSSGGLDSLTTEIPGTSMYHQRYSFQVIDDLNKNHNVQVYFILTDNTNRHWQVRTRFNGRMLTPEDTDVSSDRTGDESLYFNLNGTFDLENSSNLGLIRYPIGRINDAHDRVWLELDFNHLTTESNKGFYNKTRMIHLASNEYFLTKRYVDQPEMRVTKFGNFYLNADGFLINQFDETLMAFPILENGDSESIAIENLIPIQVPMNDLAPVATSLVSFAANLDNTATRLDPINFDLANPDTYSWKTPLTIFDAEGTSHTLELFFINNFNLNNSWAVYLAVDNVVISIAGGLAGAGGVNYASLSFDANGNFLSSTPTNISSEEFTHSSGSGVPQTITFVLDQDLLIQSDQAFTVIKFNQNGSLLRWVTDVVIDADGLMSLIYSDNNYKSVGRIALGTVEASNLTIITNSSSFIVESSNIITVEALTDEVESIDSEKVKVVVESLN